MSAFIREISSPNRHKSLPTPQHHHTPHSPTCSIPTRSGSLKSKECRIANYPGDAADSLWSPPLIALFCVHSVHPSPSLPPSLTVRERCTQMLLADINLHNGEITHLLQHGQQEHQQWPVRSGQEWKHESRCLRLPSLDLSHLWNSHIFYPLVSQGKVIVHLGGI